MGRVQKLPFTNTECPTSHIETELGKRNTFAFSPFNMSQTNITSLQVMIKYIISDFWKFCFYFLELLRVFIVCCTGGEDGDRLQNPLVRKENPDYENES